MSNREIFVEFYRITFVAFKMKGRVSILMSKGQVFETGASGKIKPRNTNSKKIILKFMFLNDAVKSLLNKGVICPSI